MDISPVFTLSQFHSLSHSSLNFSFSQSLNFAISQFLNFIPSPPHFPSLPLIPTSTLLLISQFLIFPISQFLNFIPSSTHPLIYLLYSVYPIQFSSSSILHFTFYILLFFYFISLKTAITISLKVLQYWVYLLIMVPVHWRILWLLIQYLV